jgi:hypothetical protein
MEPIYDSRELLRVTTARPGVTEVLHHIICCNGLGHRSARCPGVPSEEGDIVRPRRRMVPAKVWVPKLLATMEMKSVLAMGTSSPLPSGSGVVAAGEIVPSNGVNMEQDSSCSWH